MLPRIISVGGMRGDNMARHLADLRGLMIVQ